MHVIIFDVDGTLVDSAALHARSWQEIFLRYGKRVSRRSIRKQIGKGGDQLIRVFFTSAEIRRFGKKLLKERDRQFQKKYLRRVRPFPKVRALLERLRHDGFTVVLGSSAKKPEIRFYMKRLKISSLVDGFTTAEDARVSKPHPDIFNAARRKMGSPPHQRVLVIGDSPYDAQAARRAGLKSIGVLCGGFPRKVLKQAGYSRLYKDPADLLKRYASVFSGDASG